MAASSSPCLALSRSCSIPSSTLVQLPSRLKPSNAFPSLKLSTNFKGTSIFSGASVRPLTMTSKRTVVFVVAEDKKPDSSEKRFRQSEKRRLHLKSRKSEVRTRMKKVLKALEKVRKSTTASPEDIFPIEKLIGEAYRSIDKAVSKGFMHRNTASHRKSRLARRKRDILILRGWYKPESAV